jgi:uncharacterized protein (TIGR03085 family)
MTYSQYERAGLVNAARAAGPDAPTLCEGWTVRDLVAHLVLRESLRLDAAAGIVLPRLAARTERLQNTIAARDWEVLLDTVAAGPPWYSPFGWIDRSGNLAEMFIHQEDILRAQPDHRPREISQGLRAALCKPIRALGALTLKKTPAQVSLVTTQGQTLARGGAGGEPVTVTGQVEELLLFAYGREPADVAITGSEAALRAVAQSKRGV